MAEQIECPFRRVHPPRQDDAYQVSLPGCGLLLEVRYFPPGSTESTELLMIDVRAWDGIVAAVAELQAEAQEHARREVRVDELLYGDEIDA